MVIVVVVAVVVAVVVVYGKKADRLVFVVVSHIVKERELFPKIANEKGSF